MVQAIKIAIHRDASPAPTPVSPAETRGGSSASHCSDITMIRFLKTLFSSPAEAHRDSPEDLARAIAALLHEVMRMDDNIQPEDLAAARRALIDLAALDESQAQSLLDHAGDLGNRVTSYHAAVSVINRAFGMEHRIRLVEHLWHVAHADDELHLHEDHLIRKLSDLLHVSNTQSMLARQRARLKDASKQ